MVPAPENERVETRLKTVFLRFRTTLLTLLRHLFNFFLIERSIKNAYILLPIR